MISTLQLLLVATAAALCSSTSHLLLVSSSNSFSLDQTELIVNATSTDSQSTTNHTTTLTKTPQSTPTAAAATTTSNNNQQVPPPKFAHQTTTFITNQTATTREKPLTLQQLLNKRTLITKGGEVLVVDTQTSPAPPPSQDLITYDAAETEVKKNMIHVAGSASGSKFTKAAKALQKNQFLQKLFRTFSEHQQELVKKHPGSLVALGRALKMTTTECQHQMQDETWNCPIYSESSMKPVEVFGRLMSRSFKEAAFVHSLMSAAIAHSIARACTESIILTCSHKQTRDGGFSENVEFGKDFALNFLDPQQQELSGSASSSISSNSNNVISTNSLDNTPTLTNTLMLTDKTNSWDSSIQNHINNDNLLLAEGSNSIALGGGTDKQVFNSANLMESNHLATTSAVASGWLEMNPPTDRYLRKIVYSHNARVGRKQVLDSMRRECKCHGLSGTCNLKTCWHKLPPFREVANNLHKSLHSAINIKVPLIYTPNPTKHQHKSLTSHGEKVKKRPVTRSIPSNVFNSIIQRHDDLLFVDESPDFCVISDRYSIKGTQGRTCIEDNANSSKSCEKLCCGRGYKTEIRETKHKCECQFKFCCQLDCKLCTGRQSLHTCL